MLNENRILSIQSHVVRGYVGNKAAAFPLQLLGHHVDIINTVEFTSMYIHEGTIGNPTVLERFLRTLPMDQVLDRSIHFPGPLADDQILPAYIDHKYILTGYIGASIALQIILSFIKSQRVNETNFIWICDPVLGDNGRLYVDKSLVETYISCLNTVDVLTPNQYELQWLTTPAEQPILTIQNAIERCQQLHKIGVKQIVVTSFSPTPTTPMLTLICSEKRNTYIDVSLITFPKRNIYLGGTGDLMAAMILNCLSKKNTLQQGCLQALRIVQGVIDFTIKYYKKPYEIDVVSSSSIITNPPESKYSVTRLRYMY